MSSTASNARPSVVGADSGPEAPFPLRLNGKVIKGFGRGSKELGIPTANIPVEGLSVGGHDDVESGVYYGWAGLKMPAAPAAPGSETKEGVQKESLSTKAGKRAVDVTEDVVLGDAPDHDSKLAHHPSRTRVHPMVMSIGWNPFYKNTVRSVEVHIMHEFHGRDFYGAHMNLLVLGFIRPELDYVSKEKLIEDIKTDIDVAGRSLGRPAYAGFEKDKYLTNFDGSEQGDTAS
ncbi:MAG: riboflavin kinase [Bathelium mastoideum]|nr:MAG: riboflavin kinase [Bathelium mastoideum]